MEIQLTTPATIITQPQESKTLNSITIHMVMDDYRMKQVIAHTSELGSVVLWKDKEYDAIGQWTDADVKNKLFQLYSLS